MILTIYTVWSLRLSALVICLNKRTKSLNVSQVIWVEHSPSEELRWFSLFKICSKSSLKVKHSTQFTKTCGSWKQKPKKCKQKTHPQQGLCWISAICPSKSIPHHPPNCSVPQEADHYRLHRPDSFSSSCWIQPKGRTRRQKQSGKRKKVNIHSLDSHPHPTAWQWLHLLPKATARVGQPLIKGYTSCWGLITTPSCAIQVWER